MGDRCGMTLCCREEHRGILEEIGFHVVESGADGLHMEAAEMNYGGDSEMRELAAKGIPFYSVHAAGAEYGDGRFACDGRSLIHVDCLHGGGPPAVEVDEHGDPDPDQLRLVSDYYAVLAAAKKAIAEGRPPGYRWKSADEILKGMDPALFREQRRRLGQLIEDARHSITGPISAADVDLLDGLDSMLADLADHAHDVLGLDCLLEESEPEPEGG